MADRAQLIERLRSYRGSEDAQVLMDEAADALAAAQQGGRYGKGRSFDELSEIATARLRRALEAEAERDRLAAELAELRKEADAVQGS